MKAQDVFNPDKMKIYKNDTVEIDIFVKETLIILFSKILIPVFLILSIAWSVLWIPQIKWS